MKVSKTKLIAKLLKTNQHKKISLGLSRTRKALKYINWQKKTKSRILTCNGTSAKFSILYLIKKILIENNNTYAATFSPHIFKISERIEVNSKNISISKLKNILNKIYKIPVRLTEFEMLCLAFAEFIKSKNIQYTIGEFGLLGRKDALRALFPSPDVHIVSPILFDHLQWLKNQKGNLKTLKEIVYEKTSFLRAKKIYVSKQHPHSLRFIQHYLKNKNSFYYGRDFWLKRKKGKYFYQDKKHNFEIRSNLLGDFMYENAVLAIKVAIDEGIPLSIIKRSLTNLTIPGRMQEIKSGKLRKFLPNSTLIFADGAHNSLSSKSVCTALLNKYKNKDLYAIISMISSKDPSSFLKPFKKFKKVFFVNMKQSNVYPKETLFKISKKLNIRSTISENCNEAIKSISDKRNAVFLVTGSFYYLQEII